MAEKLKDVGPLVGAVDQGTSSTRFLVSFIILLLLMISVWICCRIFHRVPGRNLTPNGLYAVTLAATLGWIIVGERAQSQGKTNVCFRVYEIAR